MELESVLLLTAVFDEIERGPDRAKSAEPAAGGHDGEAALTPAPVQAPALTLSTPSRLTPRLRFFPVRNAGTTKPVESAGAEAGESGGRSRRRQWVFPERW
jgi:hypothetical protein